jgi:amylosucrase
LGVKGYDHRQFLNAFYTGRFAGSFARGLPFQENPKTGDCRISGTCASLAGLEQCLEAGSGCDHAIRRILLIHGIILSFGGIPLIYLGDEVGTLNDYSYRDDPHKAEDSRWAHRPRTDWAKVAWRDGDTTIEARIYKPLRQLITLRQDCAAFAGGAAHSIHTGSDHVLGYWRTNVEARVLVLANFSEYEQRVSAEAVGLPHTTHTDLVSGASVRASDLIKLEPYQLMWLQV